VWGGQRVARGAENVVAILAGRSTLAMIRSVSAAAPRPGGPEIKRFFCSSSGWFWRSLSVDLQRGLAPLGAAEAACLRHPSGLAGRASSGKFVRRARRLIGKRDAPAALAYAVACRRSQQWDIGRRVGLHSRLYEKCRPRPRDKVLLRRSLEADPLPFFGVSLYQPFW
jgi:hypothetical protein